MDNSYQTDLSKVAVLLIDDDDLFARAARRSLRVAGLEHVLVSSDIVNGRAVLSETSVDLLLLDIHLDSGQDGISFLESLRAAGYRGLVAIISADCSVDHLFRALRAGADDFLFKSSFLDLASEVRALLKCDTTTNCGKPNNVRFDEIGFLRTLGLTEREIQILSVYADGYPRQRELARLVGKSEVQIRKLLSRVYDKLDARGPGRLAHILTLCSMFPRVAGQVCR